MDFTLFNSSKLHRSAGEALASPFLSSAVSHGSKSIVVACAWEKRRTYTLRVCSFLAGMNGNPFGAYGVSAAGFYSTTGLFSGGISYTEASRTSKDAMVVNSNSYRSDFRFHKLGYPFDQLDHPANENCCANGREQSNRSPKQPRVLLRSIVRV